MEKLTLTLSTLLITFFSFSLTSCNQKKSNLITITQIVDHKALDQEREGIIDALKDAGFKDGSNIRIVYQNAQGNVTTASQIAHQFVSMKPDVMVGISTPSAQALFTQAKTHHIPMVFAAVTDPIAAKLVKSSTEKEDHITGVSDNVPPKPILEMVLNILPKAKKIGAIFNPGEINSVVWIEKFEKLCQEKGVQLVKVTASKTADISTAVNQLVDRADCLVIPRDNTAASAIETIVKIAMQHKMPVFTVDTSLIEMNSTNSAIAAASFDHYDMGYKAGKIIAEILKGTPPSKISVVYDHPLQYKINPEAAKKLNIDLPEPLLEVIERPRQLSMK